MKRSVRRTAEDIHERRRRAIPDANLLYLLMILENVAQEHDIDILVAISAFPQIAGGINGDTTILHFDEFIGYEDIRGRKGPTVSTDSL